MTQVLSAALVDKCIWLVDKLNKLLLLCKPAFIQIYSSQVDASLCFLLVQVDSLTLMAWHLKHSLPMANNPDCLVRLEAAKTIY